MDKHAAESYFVIGEGRLSETAGGRDEPAVMATAGVTATAAVSLLAQHVPDEGRKTLLAPLG